jgi:hypothetical protein
MEPDVVRAARFEVVDPDGRTRARLGTGAAGELALELADRGGTVRAVLS